MAAETLGPVGREHNASSQMYVKHVAKGANAVSLGGFPSLFLQSFKEPTPTFARLTAWDKAVLPETPLKPRTAMDCNGLQGKLRGDCCHSLFKWGSHPYQGDGGMALEQGVLED